MIWLHSLRPLMRPLTISVPDPGCLSDSRHLEDNQVSVIERGAFQDLKQLERL